MKVVDLLTPSEHTSSSEHMNRFFNSLVYGGVLKALIIPCIYFYNLTFPQLCACLVSQLLAQANIPRTFAFKCFQQMSHGMHCSPENTPNRAKQRLVLVQILQEPTDNLSSQVTNILFEN